MSRAEVTRHVAADPTSVALLLAEPASERAADSGVTITIPRRTGVGFKADIEVTDAMGRTASGEVTVEPASDAGSDVRLVLMLPEKMPVRSAERAGSGFLGELALRARSRSFAA